MRWKTYVTVSAVFMAAMTYVQTDGDPLGTASAALGTAALFAFIWRPNGPGYRWRSRLDRAAAERRDAGVPEVRPRLIATWLVLASVALGTFMAVIVLTS